MNVKEYIESGMLEAYVLGGLSPEEKLQVEAMAQNHSEIAREIEIIRTTMEKLIPEHAVVPPSSLKQRIFDRIEAEEVKKTTLEKPEPSVQKSMFSFPFNWAMAASWVIAIVFGGMAMYYNSKWKESEYKLVSIQSKYDELTRTYAVNKTSYQKKEAQLSALNDSSMQMVVLKKLPNKPEAHAQLFWNRSNGEIYLSAAYMPLVPAGSQYQLWAIVEGKPVDAGVVPTAGLNELFRMKEIKNATAFAITLEKEGGSVAPTMEEMYVMGGGG